MKTINFSVKEILPSLLDKSKTQTIRKAWAYTKQTKGGSVYDYNNVIPRFKVKEQVKLFWNQRSKYHWEKSLPEYEPHLKDLIKHMLNCKECLKRQLVLGTAEITEVFKIEMKLTGGFGTILEKRKDGWYAYFLNHIESLAKRDGFSSAEQLFKTIDKMYDLSQPKQFWVTRWKW